MEQPIIANGGLQIVPQIAVQYVYLDFDGELTSYNGEILTVDNVEVQDSSLTEERINSIVAELNAQYAAQNVIFVTERPTAAEYSTIYIGKTEAFSPYGSFAGLAETIDHGNEIKNDNAFVMLDSTATDIEIISTISHETDHLLGTLNHGGEGIAAYAANIMVAAGTTSTGLTVSAWNSMTVWGTANSTTVNSGGSMYISNGGIHRGSLYIESGAVVSADAGAIIDFSIADRTEEDDYLINALSLISGTPTYTITIAPNQAEGTYKLAQGADSFNGTISIFASESAIGTVSINGGILKNDNNICYSLGIWDNELTLKIEKNTVFIYSSEILTDCEDIFDSINLFHCSMHISSGGLANNTTVLDHGYVYIYADGTANWTWLTGYENANAYMYISSAVWQIIQL